MIDTVLRRLTLFTWGGGRCPCSHLNNSAFIKEISLFDTAMTIPKFHFKIFFLTNEQGKTDMAPGSLYVVVVYHVTIVAIGHGSLKKFWPFLVLGYVKTRLLNKNYSITQLLYNRLYYTNLELSEGRLALVRTRRIHPQIESPPILLLYHRKLIRSLLLYNSSFAHCIVIESIVLSILLAYSIRSKNPPR